MECFVTKGICISDNSNSSGVTDIAARLAVWIPGPEASFSFAFQYSLCETLSDQTDASFVKKSEGCGSTPQLSPLVPTCLWVRREF